MFIIVIPVPVVALALGFVGGYAADKFITNVEPAIDRKWDQMQARKAQRQADKAAAVA